MPPGKPLDWAPDLEAAINRRPLIVPPTMPLLEAISLISQAHSFTCSLETVISTEPVQSVQTSCVLVMQAQTLVGILTERDIVQLIAQAIDFTDLTIADVMVHPVITLSQDAIQDIFAALFLFRRYRIRHLPIVDAKNKLIGVLSHEGVRQVLRPANLLRFRRVADVMTKHVVQAPLTASLLQLAQLMTKHRVSCVVITQQDETENEIPVGIVTERDMVQFQAFQVDLKHTVAQTVMSTPLFLLSPDDSLWTAHQEMQKRRVGRLVVSWNWGQRLGIVTQTSLLRVFDPMEMYGVIDNLQQTIEQLEVDRSHLPEQLPDQSGKQDNLTEMLPPPVLSVSPLLVSPLLKACPIFDGHFEIYLTLLDLDDRDYRTLQQIRDRFLVNWQVGISPSGQVQELLVEPLLVLADYQVGHTLGCREQSIDGQIDEKNIPNNLSNDNLSMPIGFAILTAQGEPPMPLWVLVVDSATITPAESMGILPLLCHVQDQFQPHDRAWGLVTNGITYQFLQLHQAATLTYEYMPLLNLREYDQAKQLLQVLKAIRTWQT